MITIICINDSSHEGISLTTGKWTKNNTDVIAGKAYTAECLAVNKHGYLVYLAKQEDRNSLGCLAWRFKEVSQR